jgi:hypothetical protein
MDVYDVETGKLVGNARFKLSPESEKALLDLVNNGKPPKSLLLINEEVFNTPEDYLPPTGSIPVRREGIFRAWFRQDDGNTVPIEIRLIFDALVRGSRMPNKYFFDSTQYSNIKIESINQFGY